TWGPLPMLTRPLLSVCWKVRVSSGSRLPRALFASTTAPSISAHSARHAASTWRCRWPAPGVSLARWCTCCLAAANLSAQALARSASAIAAPLLPLFGPAHYPLHCTLPAVFWHPRAAGQPRGGPADHGRGRRRAHASRVSISRRVDGDVV